jgi:hypothetical protein
MKPDPGGIFASDVHRRVLAHLTTPDAETGWQPLPLVLRLSGDFDTPIPPVDANGIADLPAGQSQVEEILAELKAEGFAVRHKGDVWQMTQKGFGALTGPIANEPDPDAPVEGPAAIAVEPTPIGK